MYEHDFAMQFLYEQIMEFLEEHTVEHVIRILSDVLKDKDN